MRPKLDIWKGIAVCEWCIRHHIGKCYVKTNTETEISASAANIWAENRGRGWKAQSKQTLLDCETVKKSGWDRSGFSLHLLHCSFPLPCRLTFYHFGLDMNWVKWWWLLSNISRVTWSNAPSCYARLAPPCWRAVVQVKFVSRWFCGLCGRYFSWVVVNLFMMITFVRNYRKKHFTTVPPMGFTKNAT